MKNKQGVSRRAFISRTSFIGAGLAGLSPQVPYTHNADEARNPSREICVAALDLKEFRTVETIESRMATAMKRMRELAALKPDIVCLPELFSTVDVDEKKSISELAEDETAPGPVTRAVAEFARINKCYVACPLYTKKDGHYYNSSVLLDRKGDIVGVYHKIHPAKSEMMPSGFADDVRITPGALEQSVIETDFGKVGMQLGYDVHWTDGWEKLKKLGAEVIIYSATRSAGRRLNYFAWSCNCYIVSSSPESSEIVDMSGNVLESSSFFVRYAWSRINLNKINTDTWPTNQRLAAICRKYQNRVNIKVWGNTEVITIESRDAGLDVKDILEEFELQTIDQVVESSKIVQDQYRP